MNLHLHPRRTGRLALILLAALAMACAPKEDRSRLARRPVSTASVSGWARLPLDGAAQEAYPEVWLSDAEGMSVPFEIEREGLWQSRELELANLLLGRDAQNRPTAEFTLKFPEGWQVREREHLKVDLTLEGESPWVCRVEVDRRMKESAFLRLERDAPLHVFDLGMGEDKRGFYIPWDAQTYRLTLGAAQGKAPRITGVTVTASTRPEELKADETVSPRLERLPSGNAWLAQLAGSQRIVAADLVVKPPVAPIHPQFQIPQADQAARSAKVAQVTWVSSQGLIWNLPALDTRATRVAVGPVLADRLEVSLPDGATLETMTLLVRREVILFPAEAGKTYFLHTGGRVKAAPGNLGALPESSRAVYGREPLRLGPAEPDPHGLPILIEGAALTRPWLPWAAGLAVLLLAFFAWRLLKGSN